MSRQARLFALLGGLVATAGAYVATGGWRQRLLEESARSRQVIAVVEAARAAHEQRAARERALVAVLQTRPDDVEARLELAQVRWAAAGPRGAAAVLEAAGPRATDARLLLLLAASQRAMGREDRALATLDRAATGAAGHDEWAADVLAERALLFSLLGWFPQAREALREAEQRGATSARAGSETSPHRRGATVPPSPTRGGEPEETDRSASPAEVGRGDTWRRPALVRATMARQQGDLHAARAALEAAQRRDPDDPEVRQQLAAVAEAEGHVGEATRLLESLAPSEADPEIWVALARAYLHRTDPGGTASAKAAVQRALALRPQMPSARLLLGRCLRLSGDLGEARALLERLYRERPRQGTVAFELAQVYRELGMTDRVGPLMAQYRESLQRRDEMRRAALAVMTHPDSAPAHRDVGRLCLERGMIGRAILSLERAMRLDPRLPGVREALVQARRAPEAVAGEE